MLKRLQKGFVLKTFPKPNHLTVSHANEEAFPHESRLSTAVDDSTGRQGNVSKEAMSKIAVLVITGAGMERKRLDHVVTSWPQFNPQSVFFFSEAQKADFDLHSESSFVHVDSPAGHAGTHRVSCMLKHAADTMLRDPRGFEWFVFADDDTYVRIPVLTRLLRKYKHIDPLMLASCSHNEYPNGGAGIAVSRAWVERYAKTIRHTPSASPSPEDSTTGDAFLGRLGWNMGVGCTLEHAFENVSPEELGDNTWRISHAATFHVRASDMPAIYKKDLNDSFVL